MSQPNGSLRPNFEWALQPPQQFPYGAPALQTSDNVSQPWVLSRPRSAQPNNMGSPATSVRSTVTAPVHQRPFYSSSFHQGNAAPTDNRPHLDLLGMDMLAPPGHFTRSFSPVPQNDNEESWNIFNLRTRGAGADRTPFDPSKVSFRSFGHGPSSIGSVAPRSDSGYNSQSVVSHDAGRMDQSGMHCSLTQQAGDLNVRSTTSEVRCSKTNCAHSNLVSSLENAAEQYHTYVDRRQAKHGDDGLPILHDPIIRAPSDQRSQVSRNSSWSGDQGNPLECRVCGVVSKCNSDLKKHKIKHQKVFLCDVPRCKRKAQGFGTSNDLERHKKSVHKIGLLDKSYQCAADPCKSKTKIWPRLDNFKQHIDRMHKDDDPIELIKKSTFVPRAPELVTESVSVAPIDTMVAGMEKSLSAHSDYGSVLSAHTRPDQPIAHWPPDLNPSDVSLSFHQYPTTLPSSVSMNDQTRHSGPNDNMQFWEQQRRGSMQRNASNTSTNTIEKVAPVSRPVEEQQKKRRLEISSAPHTKAQQQQSNSEQKRLALTKLSQAVSNEIKDSSSQVDLEQVLLRILAGPSETEEDDEDQPEGSQGGRTNKVFVSKSEAMKAAQMLSSIIKQSPGSAYSQPRKGTQGFNANSVVCPHCPYAVARPCDLKKHMKRHKKPYGCTYPKCHKRFGAKSDWKRHENSQHFQLEAFRCDQRSPAGVECGEHFLRAEHFKKHLDLTHKISDDAVVAEELGSRRIGKNCQGQFWCGFERKIVELKEKRNAAWDERFDHIAFHFEKEGKGIEEWVCVEENRTKRELLKKMDRYVFDDDEDVRRRKQAKVFVRPTMNHNQNPTPTAPPMYVQNNLLKRSAPIEPLGSRKHARHETIQEMHHDVPAVAGNDDKHFCCQCHDGPYSTKITSACMNCEHVYCFSCPEE